MANLSALKAGGVPSTFCGYTALSAADGDVAVTGIGFKPSWIMLTGLYSSTAQTTSVNTQVGFKNSGGRASARSMTIDGNGAVTGLINTLGNELYNSYINGSNNNAVGILKSFDADGFTVDKQAYSFACEIYWIVGR